MSLTVLDASAFASWVVRSQRTRAGDRLLLEIADRRLIAPHIFLIEVHNVLLKAEKRGADVQDTLQSLAVLETMQIAIHPAEDRVSLDAAMTIARARRLSIYDALYLQLAMKESAELASRDKDLLDAAVKCGVKGLNLND